MKKNLRVAIVHDYLITFGGAERVLIALHEIWPEAPVFVAICNPKMMGGAWKNFADWKIKTSWFQKLPWSGKLISPLRFLLPLIWESFDFSQYDLVISSSAWAMAKGVLTKPDSLHLCYCHTPPRFLYHYPEARKFTQHKLIKIYAALVNHFLRIYDFVSSQRVDFFVANSKEVALRIKKFYRREAKVVNPPINLPAKLSFKKEDYFLFVGRLVSYKHPELAIRACGRLGLSLKIAGEGPLKTEVKKIAKKYPKIEYLARVSDKKLHQLYENCRAVIFPVEDEDFGIVPLEAAGFGKPVIALYSGGAKETVIENKTGVFFRKPTVSSLAKALEKFQKIEGQFDPKIIRKEAEKRSSANFKKSILEVFDSHCPSSSPNNKSFSNA